MQFPAIILENPPSLDRTHIEKANAHISAPPQRLKLWGLSLGMTLDLMSYMVLPTDYSDSKTSFASSASLSPALQLPYHVDGEMRVDVVAPSLASVFPRFSYPDVNFWIW
jgi:hypothetical protein